MQLKGILKVKYDTQVVSEKFSKRDFVLTVDPNGKYPQHILIQVTQDKVNLLDNFSEGQELEVDINIKGRIWNDKYFNSIEAWRITPVQGGNSAAVSTSNPSDSDDLPFS